MLPLLLALAVLCTVVAGQRGAASSPTQGRSPAFWTSVLQAVWDKANGGRRTPFLKRQAQIVDYIANNFGNFARRFGISNDLRIAHFLGQVAVESGYFKTTTEYTQSPPQWNRYQANRNLGNTKPGDGERFKGRGLIQVTGRANYAAQSAAQGVDFVSNPARLAEWPYALNAAGVYWKGRTCVGSGWVTLKNGKRTHPVLKGETLNTLSDKGLLTGRADLVTFNVNGGWHALSQRQAFTALVYGMLRSVPSNEAQRIGYDSKLSMGQYELTAPGDDDDTRLVYKFGPTASGQPDKLISVSPQTRGAATGGGVPRISAASAPSPVRRVAAAAPGPVRRVQWPRA